MIRLLSAAVLFLLPVVAAAQSSQTPPSPQTPLPALTDTRIAYFSPQRAFSVSADGKAAFTQLAALQAEKAKEIDARNTNLASQRAALEQSAARLDAAARRRREQELEKFQIDIQRFIQDAQAELAGIQRNLESAFLAKLRPALEQVVKDKGLLLVLNEDVGLIAWADPSLDVTAEVVKRMSP